jgi:hypothetical protein
MKKAILHHGLAAFCAPVGLVLLSIIGSSLASATTPPPSPPSETPQQVEQQLEDLIQFYEANPNLEPNPNTIKDLELALNNVEAAAAPAPELGASSFGMLLAVGMAFYCVRRRRPAEAH